MGGLLIKNIQCHWASHRVSLMILVASILATFIVFPSSALSQASSEQMWGSQTKNLQEENSQNSSQWPQTIISQQGKYRLTFFPAPGKIPMRRLHSWRLHIENSIGTPVSGVRIQIDGGMPAHGHGLPSVPKVKLLPGEGNYMIEGMKFTMGGEWQLRLVIIHQQADRANIMFTLNP